METIVRAPKKARPYDVPFTNKPVESSKNLAG